MYTIAVDGRPAAALEIVSLMKNIDPNGEHLAESDPHRVLYLVMKTKPDVIWLDTGWLAAAGPGQSSPGSTGPHMSSGMSGLDLASEIRKLSPYTNIVFATSDAGHALEAFRLRASGYILKPVTRSMLEEELSELRFPVNGWSAAGDDNRLRAQCFGNFEIFDKGKPIRFSRALSKEALAYLIDRRGAGCTVGEICSVLWEDRQADASLKSQCRVVLASLRKDLEAIGAGDILIKNWNLWSIDTDAISCDYYEYLHQVPGSENKFRGEYMSQYSWAEMTSGILFQEKDYEMSRNTIYDPDFSNKMREQMRNTQEETHE